MTQAWMGAALARSGVGVAPLGKECSALPCCRQKILKEKAVPMIEGYMFEEHELIRLAATECMCNMAMSKEVRAVPRRAGGCLPWAAGHLLPCWPAGAGAVPGRGQRPAEADGPVQRGGG